MFIGAAAGLWHLLVNLFAIFVFVVWFWLLISVFGDLFRRRDIGGFAKALWVIVLMVLPYLGVFAYMLSQSSGMAERSAQQAHQARDEVRHMIGFSVADELEKLEKLKKAGSISDDEFARARAALLK